MTPNIEPDHPLRKLFEGMLQEAFMVEMGVCDPKLTDYLSDLMVDFLHIDGIYRFSDATGKPIRDLTRIASDALTPGLNSTQRNRLVNRYIADCSLFWVGLYPESLRKPRSAGDRLRLYLAQGKRCYRIASELSDPQDKPPGQLLRKLGDEFECCVHGLHLVREGWVRLNEPRDEKLL